MTITELQTQIMEIYIATFNRAPDIDGLNYWTNEVTQNAWSIEDVATSMLQSTEAQITYPLEVDNTTFIKSIYQNALGRSPDNAGLEYWLNQLNLGTPKTSMVVAIINGANSPTGSADDKLFLSNKKEVANYFTFTKSLNNTTLAKNAISYVTVDTETINYAKDRIDLFEYISDETPFLLNLDDNANSIQTFNDNDIIFSWGGDDILSVSNGNNIVIAGSGNDTVYSGDNDDIIKLREGNDTAYSGAGNDIIYGDSGDDIIHGQSGDDLIYGNEGNDSLYGGDGNDIIYGGLGNDFINGGAGDDIIHGEEGDDIIYAEDGMNFVDGGTGNDIIYGGVDNDVLYGGQGNDKIYGGAGDDIIDGMADNDIIYCGLGNDIAYGSDGNDIIYGNEGNDTFDGGVGDDKIYGESGADILTGGLGKDTFYFNQGDSVLASMDTITDFEYFLNGYDKLVFVNQGSEIINQNKLNVSLATTLEEAANIASLGDGSTNAVLSWFIFQDDTYIVEDLNASPTFDDTTDLIVKLQGIVDLTGLNSSTVTFVA